MEHRFYTLDVFTNTRFEGNPLAVITDGDGLSDDEVLAIAREMNLPETVFVQRPTEDELVFTGIFNLMVPLRNRAALGKIAMNMSELRKLQGTHATMAYCFALGGNGKAFSRGMLPWEFYEDAATGSAAGSLGAYLVRHGKLAPAHTLSILQGAEMGRPSHIEVEVSQTEKKLVPRVSGAAVKVFEGTIRI